jgi:uncharacterized LabA/DUF88 family protein
VEPRTYLYVDGESHFIRSQESWKTLYTKRATSLEELAATNPSDIDAPYRHLRFRQEYPSRFAIQMDAKFYWDKSALCYVGPPASIPSRAVYVTSCRNDGTTPHQTRTFIRQAGFEPVVLEERSSLQRQRESQREKLGLIEKPKGVDIALAVRVLEDAHANAFDTCCICTSDVDYIPLVQAVRRIGKNVVILGYRAGLGKQCAFDYVPDRFFDLTEVIMDMVWKHDDASNLGITSLREDGVQS